MQVYLDYVAAQIRDIIDAYHPDLEKLSQEEKMHLDALEKCYSILSSSKANINHVALFFIGIIFPAISLAMDSFDFFC